MLVENSAFKASLGPVTLPITSAKEAIIGEMKARAIRQIPLLTNKDACSISRSLKNLVGEPRGPVHAVVMAGGYGKRLCR